MSDPKPKRLPPITLRVSGADLAYLRSLAGDMPLGTFIKSFLPKPGKSKPRGAISVADRPSLARIILLLGQSNIAVHLSELAAAARSGSLAITPDTERTLNEANSTLAEIRRLLLAALGRREDT